MLRRKVWGTVAMQSGQSHPMVCEVIERLTKSYRGGHCIQLGNASEYNPQRRAVGRVEDLGMASASARYRAQKCHDQTGTRVFAAVG